MKLLWMIPCLVLCACMNNAEQQDRGMYAETAPTYAPLETSVVEVPVSEPATNPYALQPAAYEDNNYALNQKEQELFNKEKNLLDGQQELYEREKKLANREAEFINRSKALDFKEKNIIEGRAYAPVSSAAPAPMVQQPAVQAAQPSYTMPANVPPARVYYAQPAPAPVMQQQPAPTMAYAEPATMDEYAVSTETVEFNSTSEPAAYEPAAAGFIIMQHPIQRDLVRCPASDDVCLLSYERLGYVRSANLSRFTAQDELNTAGTYPTNTAGQWRENNSIPRW